MVWFYCDDCGDSIKKPKLQNHFHSCSASSFTCIDCSRTFDRNSVKNHVTCVSEHEKYALGATKPGGFAEKGFYHDGAAPAQNSKQQGPTGMEHLTTRPPWRCNLCNVNCTSKETLMGHASGTKHMRRARAAAAAAAGTTNGTAPTPAEPPSSQHNGAEPTAPKTQSNSNGASAPTSNGASTMHGDTDDISAAAGEANTPGGVGCTSTTPAKTSTTPSKKTKKADTKKADTKKAGMKKAGSENTPEGRRVKWKMLTTSVLQAKGGKMKVSKLQKRVLARASVAGDEAVQQLMAAISGSSRFVVSDKHVQLASSA